MVVGLLAALAGAGQALAQVSIGECFSVDGLTETVFPNDQFVSEGQTIVCKSTGTEIRTSGIQAPENTSVNNVTVTIENGAAIVISGSTIGLGSNSIVTNRGLLDTRSFFNGHGISAGANSRSEMGGNTITNETTGKIITGGSNAVGILINARRAGASGNTITNAGEITTSGNNADGIRLLTTATGAVTNTITNTGTIRTGGSTAHGIRVQNATGVINLVNEGSIIVTGSGSHGIYSQGAVNLEVDGLIRSGQGFAIWLEGGAGFSAQENVINVKSGADIDGDIAAYGTLSLRVIGEPTASAVYKKGAGTLTLNGTNTYTGGTIIEEGTVALNGTLASFVEVGSGTMFGGTGTVNGNVTNAGTIQPRLNGTRSTLTIVGNYVGQGGRFVSTIGGTSDAFVADQLTIVGAGNSASGVTIIEIKDPMGLLGKPIEGEGVLLVGFESGATSTTTSFSDERIAAGAYDYVLARGGLVSEDNWYLRSDLDLPQPAVLITPKATQRQEVALYPSLPSLARQYLWSINGTLDDRRGAPEAIGQWQGQPIAWGRLIGQDTQLKPGNVNNGPGLKTNEWAVQVGVDLWRSNSDWGQWRVGPVVSIGRSAGHAYNASGTVQTGRIGLNAYSLGLNATVATEAGAYVDLLLLGTRLTGVEASSPLGTVIATTGWAYSGSLEGGWRVPMTSKLAITPQAQLYSTTVNLNNATDAFSLIKMPSNTSLLGRLGVKLSYDKVDGLGPRTQFWARASVYNTLSGQDASTSFLNLAGTNPTTFQSRAPSTWMAIDAAVDVQATQNTSVQFGLGYQTSFNSQYRSVYGQVNVRIGF